MSVERVERIIFYGEAIVRCYETMLSPTERAALHAWEASDEFTSTDLWPGWMPYIGPSPCVRVTKPQLVRRSA